MTVADPAGKPDAQAPPTQAESKASRFSLLVVMFAIGATGYFRLSARMDGLNARMDGLSTSVNARMDRLDDKIDAGIKEIRDLILSQGR